MVDLELSMLFLALGELQCEYNLLLLHESVFFVEHMLLIELQIEAYRYFFQKLHFRLQLNYLKSENLLKGLTEEAAIEDIVERVVVPPPKGAA